MVAKIVDLRKRQAKPVARKRESPKPRVATATTSSRRASPLRLRRRKIRMYAAFASLVALCGLVYGVSWVSYLPQYSVSTVAIEGTKQVSPKLVQEYVEAQLHLGAHPFLSPQNIFLFSAGAIERGIVDFFPRIGSARITRSSLFATSITVTVEERRPYALWCQSQSVSVDQRAPSAGVRECYFMDRSGFIYTEASAQDLLTVAGNAASSSRPSSMYVFAGGLPLSARTEIGTDTATSTMATDLGTTTATSTMVSTYKNPIGHSFVSAHLPGILALLDLFQQAGLHPWGATVENNEDFSIPLSEGYFIKATFGEDTDQLVRNLNLVLSSDVLRSKQNDLEYIDLRFGDRVYYKLKGELESQGESS